MDPVLNGLWQSAQQAGPFAVLIMLALWWFERGERRELQHERNVLLERMLTAMSETKDAIRELRGIVGGGRV
jgi:hypothetical protein